jgi:hypothetical protein
MASSCRLWLQPWALVTVLCVLTSLNTCYSVMCTYVPEHLLRCYVYLRPWTLVTVLWLLKSLNTCYSVIRTHVPEHYSVIRTHVPERSLQCYVYLRPWTLVTVLCVLTSLDTCYSVMCTYVPGHLLQCYVYLRPWTLVTVVWLLKCLNTCYIVMRTHVPEHLLMQCFYQPTIMLLFVCANATNTDRITVTRTKILFRIIARFHSQNTWTDSPANGRSSCFCWTDVQQQESHWAQRAVLEGREGWRVHVNISPVSGKFARRTADQFCSDSVIETYRAYSYCNWNGT